MAVVIQVDLRVCVLAVLVLVWVHWDIRSFQRDIAATQRKELLEIKKTLEGIHKDLQTLKSKAEAIIDILTSGITVRDKQRGTLDIWGGIICRVIAMVVHPIGIVCDLVLDIIDAVKS